jgi:uncharacterized protein DUF4429
MPQAAHRTTDASTPSPAHHTATPTEDVAVSRHHSQNDDSRSGSQQEIFGGRARRVDQDLVRLIAPPCTSGSQVRTTSVPSICAATSLPGKVRVTRTDQVSWYTAQMVPRPLSGWRRLWHVDRKSGAGHHDEDSYLQMVADRGLGYHSRLQLNDLRAFPVDRARASVCGMTGKAQPLATADGHTGQVSFDGVFVTITRKGFRARATVGKGEKRIPLSSIDAVQSKPAGPVTNGLIQFTVPGGNERRSGFGHQTSSAVGDENSVVFTRKQMPAFEVLRKAVEQAIAVGSQPSSPTRRRWIWRSSPSCTPRACSPMRNSLRRRPRHSASSVKRDSHTLA